MTTAIRPNPFAAPHPALTQHGFFRLTVDDYHDLGDKGILTAADRVELLDGYLVKKPMPKPPHASTVVRLDYKFRRMLPDGWQIRTQQPIALAQSEPEPDGAVVRGDLRSYDLQHPNSTEVALAIEVSDTTLRLDREFKGSIYAGAGIPLFWILNLVENIVEVYSQPSGPGDDPKYQHRQDFTPSESLPLILDGQQIALIPVAELLP